MARGDAVQQIKDKLDILEVVGSYVELHKAGRHYKGRSPFTNEKTPSFFVSPDRGMYYCFSSQKGGDIFTFIQEMEGVDFKGALKVLAERAGVELVPEDPKKRDAREQQYALIEEATKFFFKRREENPAVTNYITDRGVKGETIHAWRIGYAPDDWRVLRSHLAAKKFTDEEMLRAGLIKRTDDNKEPYDVFRDRVMFPIADPSGRIVAFSGRTLKKDDNVPKYVNSPETELFQKSEILYGYDKAKQGIRHYDFSLIVEGQFDVVLSHQAGYTNAVAVSGTALTSHHIMLLSRLSNRAVLALDSDGAGIRAVRRSSELMLSRGMDVKVARMEGGKDPADMITDDPKLFKKAIGKAVHVIEFLLEVLKTDTKDERTLKLRMREEILPLILSIPNQIDRDHFVKIAADATSSREDAVRYEMERIREEEGRRPVHEDRAETVREPERTSTRREDLIRFLAAVALSSDSKHTELRTAARTAFEEILPKDKWSPLADPGDSVFAKMLFTTEKYLEETDERNLKTEIAERLTELSHLIAREELAELRQKMHDAEQRGDEAELKKCLEATKGAQISLQKVITL